MQAVFAPSPPLDFGQSGAGLPLAPWALLLGWGSPEPETNAQRVLLRGEAGLGVRKPFVQIHQQCPPSPAGLSAPKPRLPNGTNRAHGRCSLQRDLKRSSGSTHQPHRAFAQESNARRFRSQPAAGRREKRRWAALGSLGPLFTGGLWSLKPTPNVFSFAGKHDWVCESLLCKYTNNAPRAQLGRSAPKPRLPNGTNRAPGRCSLQGDLKRSSGSTHQPHRAYAQESTQAVLAPSPPVEVGQSGAGLPRAPWALSLLGVSGA